MVGTLQKSKTPDAGQGPALQADFSKDRKLLAVLCFLHSTNLAFGNVALESGEESGQVIKQAVCHK